MNSACVFHLRIEITCLTYTPAGFCGDFQSIFDYPVKIAVNTSHAGNITKSQDTANIFKVLLTSQLNVHKQCLRYLLPFICRWTFPTCDPAYNVSIEQYICRRACEILTNFVCNEVWLFVLSQLNNLKFLAVNIPICDHLDRANGGEAPDCIDTLDGGGSCSMLLHVLYYIVIIMCIPYVASINRRSKYLQILPAEIFLLL